MCSARSTSSCRCAPAPSKKPPSVSPISSSPSPPVPPPPPPKHAFLPHFRTEAVRGLVAAVGISPAPIRWEKDPNRSARIVIFIVAPLRDAALYLQVVGAFARALSDPDTVLALLAAKTAEQVVRLAALDAVELPSQL